MKNTNSEALNMTLMDIIYRLMFIDNRLLYVVLVVNVYILTFMR